MMIRPVFLAFALLVPSTALGGSSIAEILMEDRPEPPTEVGYRYTMNIDATMREGSDPMETLTAAIRVDPSQPPGERTDLLFMEGSGDDEALQLIEEMRKEIEDADNTPEKMAESFYCTLNSDVSHAIESETEAEAVLRPDPTALMQAMQGDDPDEMSKRDRKIMEKIAKRMVAEVRLDKPSGQLTSQSVRLTEPVTIMMIAKIKQMEFAQTCTEAPNGFMRSETFTMLTEAGALGESMESVIRFDLSDLDPIVP